MSNGDSILWVVACAVCVDSTIVLECQAQRVILQDDRSSMGRAFSEGKIVEVDGWYQYIRVDAEVINNSASCKLTADYHLIRLADGAPQYCSLWR